MANHSTLQTCHNLLTKQQQQEEWIYGLFCIFKILKPSSFVFNSIALLWNNRDESYDWIQKTERALGV